MAAAVVEDRLTYLWETPKTVRGWLGTVDHKELGIRYLVTAFIFLLVGGVEALLVRIQLARPDMTFLSPEAYDQIFTMHGVTMIFWYASPILSGFAIYMIPLMIGARDVAFPRLNSFTYWSFLFSGVLLYISPFFRQAPHGGWFAYVPYTLTEYSPGIGMDIYALALIFITISTTANAINFVVTILRLRAPGMAISRMPLFAYSTLTISLVILFALPALSAACVFLELERRWGMHFFGVAGGGDIFLWQQLFWFFGHPWVYVIFLPATGMISMIIPVFSRRPIVGYAWVAISTMLTGLVGFGVWLHHMFTVGMSDMAMSFFSAGSMTISIFTTIQVFAWLATIWKGKPVATASMYYASASVALLVIGGLSGIFTGIIPVDWQVHNTYYVVAHIHYVLIGANVFPVFAGFYYWLPKMMGRMMNETLGKLSFWVMFIGFNVGFFPMHITGLLGMPRRVYTYPAGMGFATPNLITTIGAFVLAVGILVFVVNVIYSLRRGAIAGPNPWDAPTLEWSVSSPPPPYNFTVIPSVASRHPLWEQRLGEGDGTSVLERGLVLDHEHETLGVTAMDAEPDVILKMPGESYAPFLMTLCLSALFTGLLAHIWALAGAGVFLGIIVGIFWLWPLEEAGERAI